MAQFPLYHGKQVRLMLIDPDAARISLSKVTDYKWKDDNKEVESIGLDGVRDMLITYHGVSGGFTVELADFDLYDFADARKREYQATGLSRYSTLYVYFDNPDGSTITYQCVGTTLTIEDRGNAKHDETVKVQCKFMAQDAQRV